jgi:hypothetical protein
MGLEQVKIRLRRYETRVLCSGVMIVAVGVAAIARDGRRGDPAAGAGGDGGRRPAAGRHPRGDGAGLAAAVPKPRGDDAAACVAFLRERLLDAAPLAHGGWAGCWRAAAGHRCALRHPGQEAGSLWLSRMGPLVGLFLLWLVVMLLTQRRAARLVDRELAELDRLGFG